MDNKKMSFRAPPYKALATHKEKPGASAALLTEAEQRQLAQWNATQQDYPRDACVQQLVARQATARPNAIALVRDDNALSYRELNQRANQLAHYLQQLGVRPGVCVALCVERSFEMVIGLLGILKAGGAYVPLDASYPPDRLAFMIEDAGAPVLITQRQLAGRLPGRGARMVYLDADAEILIWQSTDDPVCSATIDDLAYVIYTSGSTGRPKGVQITNNSLLNLVFWHQRAFAITAADRATQLTSPAFDATGWELWPYLTAGASVYLIDDDTRLEASALRDWLVEQRITVTFLPTVLAESALQLEWPATTALRYLLTGADTLHRYPSPGLPFALVNNYGPTEATVLVTSGRVPATENASTPPPIGRPIANTQIYILDEQLRQVPPGEAGELCIGGVGLADGYLNRPELTAEKFIAHPFSDEPGARLYRTGDLARWLPDGQIAFLGRIDRQLKIRGYRIEPAEIVAALQTHSAVQACCVTAYEETPGDKRLVAYIVLKPGAQLTLSALREPLITQLPDYMIPGVFVLLEALPITPNGKVDYAVLPAPDATNMLREEDTATPQTLIEEKVAGIVSRLLNLEQVGMDENFFLLGGHSLLGTQVITHLAETFGVELPLLSLFSAPTVRQLSAEVERRLLVKMELISENEVQQLLQ